MNIIGSRKNRIAAIAAVCVGALLLAACSAGGGHKRDADGNMVPTARELDPAGTLYAETVAKADAGPCDANTVNVLTCFAYRGYGYEGAQTALGQCLIRSSKVTDGVAWLKRAANAGWPDAQKHLSELYAAGKGVPQDNIEAATWNDLYVKNPSLLSLGIQPDTTMSDTLRQNTTSEERNAAHERAEAWSPVYWQPKEALNAETAATCRVRMKKQAPNKNMLIENDPDAVGAGGY